MDNLTRQIMDAFDIADKCYERSRALALKYLLTDFLKYEKVVRLEYYFLGKMHGIAKTQEIIRNSKRQENNK